MMTTRVPVDSAEAAELREVEAERERDDHHAAHVAHDPRCRGGWLGEDAAGRPRPCPRCRSHLQQVTCLCCLATENACASRMTLSGRSCCDQCSHPKGGR